MQFNYRWSATIISTALLATSLYLAIAKPAFASILAKPASAEGLPAGMTSELLYDTQTSDILIAQSVPSIKIPGQRSEPPNIRIPGQRSGPVIRIPGQRPSPAGRSIVLINGTSDWITYFLNGEQFQLKAGTKRAYVFESEENPVVKFDAMNLGQYQTQTITRNLTPGYTYTFKRGNSYQVDLH